MRGVAKQQITLRIDPDVLDKLRTRPGLTGLINEAQRKVVRLRNDNIFTLLKAILLAPIERFYWCEIVRY